MKIDTAIKSRRSVRKFKSKKPNWRDIIECIDAARHAPMAGGNYTVRFILVSDHEKIRRLADASQQDFIAETQYAVVVCTSPSRTVNAYGERGKRYCRQQAGAAIQNFLLKITELGLASCWVGHFEDEEVRRIVKIPDNANPEAILPIGYVFKKKKGKKHRTHLDNILFFDEYKNKKMKKPRKLDI